MKTAVVILCLSFTAAFSQKFILTHTQSGQEILLGEIPESELGKNDFVRWYEKNFNAYSPDSSLTNELANKLGDKHIQIFLGTWCGDSRREVPKFMKVLHSINFNFDNLSIIAVDYERNDMKQSPGHEEYGKQIYRVPTFIVSKDSNEVGRIVEFPVETLEKDLLNLANGSYTYNYDFYYRIVEKLEGLSYEQMKSKEKEIYQEFKEYYEGNNRLVTLCKVLFCAQEISKSRFLMELQLQYNPGDAATVEYFNRIHNWIDGRVGQ